MRSLEVDIRFESGAVRVKKASGFSDRRTVSAIEAMLRALWGTEESHENRKHVDDVIRGDRQLPDLYVAYLRGKLGDLPPAGEDRDLEALKDEWMAEFQASTSHKNRYRQAFACLLKQVRHKARVSESATLLETYRTACVASNTPRAFNYAKQGLLALTRDKLGPRHPLRTLIKDVPPMPEAKEGVKGMSAAEARAIRQKLIDAAARPLELADGTTEPNPNRDSLLDAARIWWATCCTGMGTTEMWGAEGQAPEEAWKVLGDRIRIKGTKRPGRRWGSEGRDVPLICTVARPRIGPEFYAKLLRKYAKAAPRQGRKTFACVMEDAEIPRTRRKLYLGHGAKDVTDRYERRDITAFLADDRARLLKQFGTDAPAALQLSRTHGMVVQPLAMEA